MHEMVSMGIHVSSADRGQLIDEIVYICCNPSKCSEQEQQSVRSRLVSYATRLADSTVGTADSGDPDTVFQSIRQRLLQQQRQNDAARFAELYQQLAMYDGLSSRGRYALLSLLQQLTEEGATAIASSILRYRPLQLPKALPLRLAAAGVQHSSNQPLNSKVLRPIAAQQGGFAAVDHQQHTAADSDVKTVKQLELVRDMLRVVQGLTGRYCSFNPASAAGNPAMTGPAVVIAPHDQLKLQVGYRTLMHELGELGLLYRRVLAAIQACRSPHTGSVRQALCAALGEEVTDFYRLMAVLEAQLATPQPTPGADTTEATGSYLSLRRLQLWLAEPMRRMRFLAVLVDGCANRVGGDLAGRVWAASKVGDPLASSYATRLLHQMCVPLFDMIRRWVFEGVLEDPACEFFIVPSGINSGSNRDLWRDAYRIEPAKLPPFINAEVAATILRAGKSINFLRDACSDAQWVQEWAPVASEAAAELGYGQLPVLERVVGSAGRRVDARLMAVLQNSGELDKHCQAIRRYLLLGQGDFVVALLDFLGPELNKTARDVSEVTLNHLLRTALLASAGGAQDEGGVQDRLKAVKAPTGDLETGWDAFSLQYQLGPPLSSIFTSAAQSSYSRLSKLLWFMRRTENSLGQAWKLLKVDIERAMPRFKQEACRKGLDDLLSSCLHLRAEMAHFVINMQYYVNLEVLECAWAEFMSASAAALDLDCLIAAHDKFLDIVLARALLGPGKAEGLRRTLNQLLRTCMSLAPMVQRFCEKVQIGADSLSRRAIAAEANKAAGRWGTTASRIEPAVSEEEINDLKGTWSGLVEVFKGQLTDFLRGLPPAADEVNAEVRFLMARLNFSDYYRRDDVPNN